MLPIFKYIAIFWSKRLHLWKQKLGIIEGCYLSNQQETFGGKEENPCRSQEQNHCVHYSLQPSSFWRPSVASSPEEGWVSSGWDSSRLCKLTWMIITESLKALGILPSSFFFYQSLKLKNESYIVLLPGDSNRIALSVIQSHPGTQQSLVIMHIRTSKGTF